MPELETWVGQTVRINDFLESFICSLLLILFSWLLHFVLQFLFPQKNKQQQTRNKARQRNTIKEGKGNDTKRKNCNMHRLLWNPSNLRAQGFDYTATVTKLAYSTSIIPSTCFGKAETYNYKCTGNLRRQHTRCFQKRNISVDCCRKRTFETSTEMSGFKQ
jgi:hypothetical protein